MRLAPCQNCRKLVEETARFCPQCGLYHPHQALKPETDLPPAALPADGFPLVGLLAGTACAGGTIAAFAGIALMIGLILVMFAAVLQFFHALFTCKM